MKKSRIRPIAEQFNYEVFWSAPDDAYIAVIEGEGSLSWITSSEKRSLKGIKQLVRDCIRLDIEDGKPFFLYPNQMPQRAKITKQAPLLEYERDIYTDFMKVLEEVEESEKHGLSTSDEALATSQNEKTLERTL